MTRKKSAISTSENEVAIDFGERKINSQNFSKTVVLPKTALTGCGCNLDEDLKVNVQLVQSNGEKFIKLIPVCQDKVENQKKKEKK